MSEVKFTKGEWRLQDGLYPSFTEIHCGKSMIIPVCTLATDITYEKGVERQANAHLIAAAPEMYKALERVKQGHLILVEQNLIPDQYEKDIMNAVNEIDKLLAKARGEL